MIEMRSMGDDSSYGLSGVYFHGKAENLCEGIVNHGEEVIAPDLAGIVFQGEKMPDGFYFIEYEDGEGSRLMAEDGIYQVNIYGKPGTAFIWKSRILRGLIVLDDDEISMEYANTKFEEKAELL